MIVNNRSKGYEIAYLQSWLADKYDKDLSVSGLYDQPTHKELIQYLRIPDTLSFLEVREVVQDLDIQINKTEWKKFNFVFTIESDMEQLLCTQKTTAYTEEKGLGYVQSSYLADSIMDVVKPAIFQCGWTLTYSVNEKSKFVIKIVPIREKELMPKKEMLAMINLAGYDFLEGYHVKGEKIEQAGFEEVDFSMANSYFEKYNPDPGDNKIRTKAKPLKLNVTDEYKVKFIREVREALSLNSLVVDFPNIIELTYFTDQIEDKEEGYGKMGWYICTTKYSTPETEGQEIKKYNSYIKINAADYMIQQPSEDRPFQVGEKVQISLSPSYNRVYFINDINENMVLDIAHSFDSLTNVRVFFYRDNLTSSVVQTKATFNFISELKYGYNPCKAKLNYYIPPNNSLQIGTKENPIPKGTKSIAVEISSPTRTSGTTFKYKGKTIIGDLTNSGIIEPLGDDLAIANDYLDRIENGMNYEEYANEYFLEGVFGDTTYSNNRYRVSEIAFNEYEFVEKITGVVGETETEITEPYTYKIIQYYNGYSEERYTDFVFDKDLPSNYSKIKIYMHNYKQQLVTQEAPQATAMNNYQCTIRGNWKLKKNKLNNIYLFWPDPDPTKDGHAKQIMNEILDISYRTNNDNTKDTIVTFKDSIVIPDEVQKANAKVIFDISGIVVNNENHYYAMNQSYHNLEPESLFVTRSDIENAVKVIERCWAYEEYFDTVDRIITNDKKSQYLYVRQTDPYTAKYVSDEETRRKVFKSINFNGQPFLIHDTFFDYLLDSSIHKNSEEERIKHLYEYVYEDKMPYKGYTGDLRKKVFDIQLENNLPFPNGFADTDTLYILRE